MTPYDKRRRLALTLMAMAQRRLEAKEKRT